LSQGKQLINLIINSLFRYNQKTYKVERIDFAQSPDTTFDKSGTQVSIIFCVLTLYLIGVVQRVLQDPLQ
jgi:hypothetical protein